MTEAENDELQSCVARGAAWLDKAKPGWWAKVELDRLRMNECAFCVLGQLFGGYMEGVFALRTDSDLAGSLEFEFRVDFPVRFGFQSLQRYSRLTELWKTIIENKRKEAECQTPQS